MIKPIEITYDEAICIDISCSNAQLSKSAFLQVGSILVAESPRMVLFSLDDLWSLREHINITFRVGALPCGLSLKQKVYGLLLQEEFEKEVGIPVGDLEEANYADNNRAEDNPQSNPQDSAGTCP